MKKLRLGRSTVQPLAITVSGLHNTIEYTVAPPSYDDRASCVPTGCIIIA